MFKEKDMLNRLSQHVKIMDSRCNGKLMEVCWGGGGYDFKGTSMNYNKDLDNFVYF